MQTGALRLLAGLGICVCAAAQQLPPLPAGFESWPDFVHAAAAQADAQIGALPDFICTRTASGSARFGAPISITPLPPWDAEVTYLSGQEHYRVLNGQSVSTPAGVITGGEFAATLRALFDPLNGAVRRIRGTESINGTKAIQVEADISAERSNISLNVLKRSLRPAYRGECWIDPSSRKTLRLSVSIEDLPGDFVIRSAGQTVDFGWERIGDKTYWLPVRAESRLKLMSPPGPPVDLYQILFGRAGSMAWKTADVTVDVTFSHYRKFQAESRIIP